MTTALHTYPKPTPRRQPRHLRPLDPWDAPHTLEERADYMVEDAQAWIARSYDRRAYRAAKRRVILSDSERVVLETVEDFTIYGEIFAGAVTQSATALAALAGRSVSAIEKALISLKKRHILLSTPGRKFPYNQPDTIGINPAFAEWRTDKTNRDMELHDDATPMELHDMELPKDATPAQNMVGLQAMELHDRATINKSLKEINNNNTAREDDVSHHPQSPPIARPPTPYPKPEPQVPPVMHATWDREFRKACPQYEPELFSPASLDLMRQWERADEYGADRCVQAVEWLFLAKVVADDPPSFVQVKGYLEAILATAKRTGKAPGHTPRFRSDPARHDSQGGAARASRPVPQVEYAQGSVGEVEFTLPDGRRMTL